MGAYTLVVNRDSGPEMPLDAAGKQLCKSRPNRGDL
jgi:hypothetical protein